MHRIGYIIAGAAAIPLGLVAFLLPMWVSDYFFGHPLWGGLLWLIALGCIAGNEAFRERQIKGVKLQRKREIV